jgi:DNA-directed RNA polymerase subunit RPC12/RpoP
MGAVLMVIIYFVTLLLIWLVCGVVAQAVAPDRRATFFWVTFLILGPLGVAAALIAQPSHAGNWRPVAAGRRRFVCPRCGAENDIPEKDASYDCWRCSERRKVEPKKTEPPAG